ncbi:MAG: GDP-mannose 4,6-dehydratase [Candidatus Omnitrophica bacterium]|nr:GDP-mannose 4,6-dehydratase [Candidatus Omnitrophota bacterium]
MAKNKASLLIGASGLVGRFLGAHLAGRGETVYGTVRKRPAAGKGSDPRVRTLSCDVRRRADIERALRASRPDRIYFLAAQSSVREAWLSPVETMKINLLGGLNLLEVLRERRSRARALIFSSGTTYGLTHLKGVSLTEEACFLPKDPYSVSKMAIDFLARSYAKVYGLEILVARLANFMGPGQSKNFSISNFAYQIAGIEAGKLPPVIGVGNLEARRDYVDVRDGVRALRLILEKGRREEAYHVSSGRSRPLKEMLDRLLALSRVGRNVRIVKKTSLMSKDEIQAVRLSPSKLRRRTGWKPQIPLDQSLLDILEYWRNTWNEN